MRALHARHSARRRPARGPVVVGASGNERVRAACCSADESRRSIVNGRWSRVMPPELTLAGITLIAATINGALGYGFSSITVPLALFFFTNRVLNPALVLLEVALNANVLW